MENDNSVYKALLPLVSIKPEDVMSEMSYYMLPSQLTMYPYNPDDLVQKKGLFIYDRMKDDEVIKVALLLKKTVMLSNNIEIEAISTDPADQQAADFIKYVLFEQLEQPLNCIIEQVLSAFDYGYSISEKLFQHIEDGPFTGYIGIKNIKTRPPHGFDFSTDEFGTLKAVRQFQGTAYCKDLPPDKFLIHTYCKTFGNPYGVSDQRAIYRPWWCKDIVLKLSAIHLERYGTPAIIAYYKGILNKEEEKNIKTILKFIQTGTGFQLPDEKVRIDKLEFSEAKGYAEALDRYDKMMTRGLLMPDHLGFTNTSAGSYALGQEQFGIFYLVLQKFFNDLLLDIQKQIVEPLVKFNFGVKKAPKLKVIPTKPEDIEKLAAIYINMTNAGYMSPTNKSDMNFIRSKYGLPETEATVQDITLSADSNSVLTSIKKNEGDFQKILGKVLPKLSPADYQKFIGAYKSGNYDEAMNTVAEFDQQSKDMIAEALRARFADGKDAAAAKK